MQAVFRLRRFLCSFGPGVAAPRDGAWRDAPEPEAYGGGDRRATPTRGWPAFSLVPARRASGCGRGGRGVVERRLPNFFIAGTMRSGTTSLARYLDAHPEVFVSHPKEIHFFDLKFDKGIEWYSRLFANADGAAAAGDATPSYVYLEDAVTRMAQTVPEARVIITLRNPIDRAYSHYWLRRSIGAEHLDFEDAVEAEPERLALGDPRRACPYLDMGRYLPQLERLCEHFPRSRVHVFVFEDLRDDPLPTYQSVCRFLGVEESFVPTNIGKVVNPFVTFRSVRVRKAKRHLPGLLRKVVGRLNTTRSSYPPMDPDLRADLEGRFAADNAALAKWLERDLSVWGGPRG